MRAVTCFHNPNEENGYLSNWYPSRFEFDGIGFSSMEQYMMHCKARCFGDLDSANHLLGIDNPAEIKQIGRAIANYDDHIWNGIRQITVYKGLRAKFRQNPELAAQLESTGNALLAECAVKDRIWGIGLSMHDPARFNPEKWQGQNLLGYALIIVRDELRGNIQ